jgi:hypothetical protein
MLMISQGTFESAKAVRGKNDLLKEKSHHEIDSMLDLVRFRENYLIKELQQTT